MTLGQGWESTDILAIDLPGLLDKFQQIKGRRMPAAGLERYSQRLIEAIELFRLHAQLAEPVEPLPPVVEPSPLVVPSHEGPTEPARLLNGAGGSSYLDHQLPPPQDPADLNGSQPAALPVPTPVLSMQQPDRLTYPFPLREGVVVTVCLPVDMTKAESERLGRFIDCLAVEGLPRPAALVKRRRAAAPRTATASSSRPRPAPATSRARSAQPVAAARRSRSAGPS